MGSFQGGLLWLESLPPYTTTGLGPEVKGSNHVLRSSTASHCMIGNNRKTFTFHVLQCEHTMERGQQQPS
eukprot:11620686-Prorocentrum_lima.AAC.1